jgi:hypothetical protein
MKFAIATLCLAFLSPSLFAAEDEKAKAAVAVEIAMLSLKSMPTAATTPTPSPTPAVVYQYRQVRGGYVLEAVPAINTAPCTSCSTGNCRIR